MKNPLFSFANRFNIVLCVEGDNKYVDHITRAAVLRLNKVPRGYGAAISPTLLTWIARSNEFDDNCSVL